MSSKYYLEIDASGFEAPVDEGRWLGYGLITAEGNSLEECLREACVDLIDQDGGEFALRPADSDEMQDAVEEEFWRRYPSGVREVVEEPYNQRDAMLKQEGEF